MYKGDERTRTLEISIDNLPYTTWTSSGTTTGFETIELDTMGRWISIVGVLADSEWLSIMEVKIMIDDGEAGSDDNDTTTNASGVEASTLGSVTAGASFYDPSLAVDGGCDPSGCVADNTRDGDLSTASRWSCAPTLGGECTISYDLGTAYDLDELRLAMFKGTERQVSMEVRVDDALVTTWTSSGTTDGFEAIDLSGTWGQVLEITGVLDDSEWLSIIEVSASLTRCSAAHWSTRKRVQPTSLAYPFLVLRRLSFIFAHCTRQGPFIYFFRGGVRVLAFSRRLHSNANGTRVFSWRTPSFELQGTAAFAVPEQLSLWWTWRLISCRCPR
ncbi:unnamed protein product [Ectocarpus sp. 8 AP-2014]